MHSFEFIHPHHVDCGLKLREWNHADSNVWRIINAAWAKTDDVRALSDYGGEKQLMGERGEEDLGYKDIAMVCREIRSPKAVE